MPPILGGSPIASTKWRLTGEWIKNCNCAFGCPCDFNARPTYGTCKGLVGMHVQQGHFGDVPLDGVKFMVTVDFPGPLHEGNQQHRRNQVRGAAGAWLARDGDADA